MSDVIRMEDVKDRLVMVRGERADETESSLELNFFIGKLKHTVRRVKKAAAER